LLINRWILVFLSFGFFYFAFFLVFVFFFFLCVLFFRFVFGVESQGPPPGTFFPHGGGFPYQRAKKLSLRIHFFRPPPLSRPLIFPNAIYLISFSHASSLCTPPLARSPTGWLATAEVNTTLASPPRDVVSSSPGQTA